MKPLYVLFILVFTSGSLWASTPHACPVELLQVSHDYESNSPVYKMTFSKKANFTKISDFQEIKDYDGYLSLFLLWNFLSTGVIDYREQEALYLSALKALNRLHNYYSSKSHLSGSEQEAMDLVFTTLAKVRRGRANNESFAHHLEPNIGDLVEKLSKKHSYTVKLDQFGGLNHLHRRLRAYDIFLFESPRTAWQEITDPQYARYSPFTMSCVRISNMEARYAFLGIELEEGGPIYAETTSN